MANDDRRYEGEDPHEAVKTTHKPRAFDKMKDEFRNRSWKYMDDATLDFGKGNSLDVGPGRFMFRKTFKF